MVAAPRHSPPSERNKEPILAVLRQVLGERGEALEIASGTGQHVAHFAQALPGWTWQPSDRAATPDKLAALADDLVFYCDQASAGAGLPNVRAPLPLDVLDAEWAGIGKFDAIFCANMLHIAPWACCAALMRGAARHLRSSGVLITYGPYFETRAPAAPGNLAFDDDLRARNPQWGIRQLTDVVAETEKAGLKLRDRFEMPANNLTLVFNVRSIGARDRI